MGGSVKKPIDLENLPSAGECGMDFARCQSCLRIRWVTPAALEAFGVRCLNCGSKIITDAWRIRLWERPTLFRWFLWEIGQMNSPGWWLNPFSLARVLWIAAHPEIEYYDQNQAPPRGEVGNEAR